MKSQPKTKGGTLNKIRALTEEIFLRAIRFYTYNTPIDKGKYRLVQGAMWLCRYFPTPKVVRTKDGRKISANLESGIQSGVYFFGEYEKVLTRIVASLLKPGNVCFDVGANFGWYTSLFYMHAGEIGSVHAFEPVPSTFAELKGNHELIGSPRNIFINKLALGNERKEVAVNLFEGLATGHASLSRHGRKDFLSFRTEMITLDSYLEENRIANVDFVKVDIEGAEMMFLEGAEKLFLQEIPPIFLMEMALAQTQSFGYLPNDLINFIGARARYDFYKVDEYKDNLIEINDFPPDDIGANVICIPKDSRQEKFDLSEWLS